MLRATFQLTPGVGPARERQLWSAGVTRWEAFPSGPEVALSPRIDGRLREALCRAGEALARRDAEALAEMMPNRERWRLYPTFAEEAAYLDIETDGRDLVTAIGVLDRRGPRVFLRGRDLERFPEAAAGWKLLVTFNGLSFDVPMLRRAFPDWRPPRAHVDLRHLWRRLGHAGGLKRLEAATGVGRPDHLHGVDGLEAVRLWEQHRAGVPGALRLLAEYNLHDAVNLKALMALGYNRMLGQHPVRGTPVPLWERAEVLQEMSRALQAIEG